MASRKPELDRILRDKFAMEAMKILIPIIYNTPRGTIPMMAYEYTGKEAYSIANKMMEYRNKINLSEGSNDKK